MDEHQEHHENHDSGDAFSESVGSRSKVWLLSLVIALIGVAGLGVGYGIRQQGLVSQMTAREADNTAAMNQMRGQIDSLTAKLNQMTAQQQQMPPEPTPPPVNAAQPTSPSPASPSRSRSASGPSRQMRQLQAQLTDQQKQLKDTQDALDKTRSDLQTSLSATRDDLNGSIGRTHEEVVALSKRGERNFFEFELVKSKQFERSGPLSLSLRKADTKHQRIDLNLIVDDVQLSKKSVNLYEPIWIHRADDPQPVQIVINKIEKDHVRGYVSAPKYRQSELSNVSYSQPPATPSPSSAPSPRPQDNPQPNSSPAQPPDQQPHQ
jgi:septal ring factor EnvC (AmiA/AmiB activator)